MPNLSDKLTSKIITQTINLLRLSDGMFKPVLRVLNALEKELLRDLEDVTGKTAFTISRMKALFAQTRQTISTAYDKISVMNEAGLIDTVALVADQTVAMIDAAIGASVTSVGWSPQQVEAIAKNTLIDGLVSADWWAKQSASLRDKFARQMKVGQMRGETIDQLAARVRGTSANAYKDGIMQADRMQARTLVRTAVLGVSNEARLQTYLDNSEVVKGVRWLSTLDNRTTEICIALDGKQWHFPTADAQQQVIERRVADAIKANGGITVNLAGAEPHQGFAFAPSKATELKMPLSQLDAAAVRAYTAKWWNSLREDGAHIGGWKSGNDAVLDISTVQKDELDALVRAKIARQDAIYDLGSGTEIPTDVGLKKYGAQEIKAATQKAESDAIAATGRDAGTISKENSESVPESGIDSGSVSFAYADYIPVGHDKEFSPPPAHFNCRSVLVPITFSWEELAGAHGNSTAAQIADQVPEGERSSMDGQVSSKTTMQDWLNTRTDAQIDEQLGVGKAKLWREGKITLSDLTNTQNTPLTLEQLKGQWAQKPWVDHAPGAPLDTLKFYTQPDGSLTPERQALHDSIISKFFADKTPVLESERSAIVMMGGSASGKSTIVDEVLSNNVVHIDADAVKAMLPEYQTGLAAKARDTANSVHNESKVISHEILERAFAGNYNVIVDATGANADKYSVLFQRLKSEGYTTRLFAINIDVEEAIARNAARAEKTWRFVPENVLRDIYKKIPQSFSQNSKLADGFMLFDTMQQPPRLIWALTPEGEFVYDASYAKIFGYNENN